MPDDRAISAARDGGWCLARRGVLPNGRLAYAELKMPPFALLSRVTPSVVVLALLVIAASSVLLGRALAVPLRRMSTTARAFGGGNLRARVRLKSDDELGEVARAFDEMAERVNDVLRGQRELIANVSHELRTPLARIRVALDLAAEGDEQVARESFKDIAGDLDELERLIGDVLTAARLDLDDSCGAGAIPPLRCEPVDVGELVERAAVRFRAAHPERLLVVDAMTTGRSLDGDPVLLRRVLENLLENAHKYSERADDPVEIRVDDGDPVRVRVIDRGVGISGEDLKRTFRPFFRADRSRARSTGGLGLGLVLVRRIVEAHGGSVRLDSEVGRGTVATVLLPATSPHPSPEAIDRPALTGV